MCVCVCFFLNHLRSFGKLCPFLSAWAANTTAVSMVLSRLDYCHSCWGEGGGRGPSQQLERLQLVQHTAARTVIRTRKREHITPVLNELHWLPVRKRIDHKIMSLAYRCYEGTAPEYLQELIPRYIPARSLLSTSQPTSTDTKCY